MAEALSSKFTQSFPDFLNQMGVSVLVSTYQAGKLILLRPQGNTLNTHFFGMEKPMGIALQDAHLAIGTGFQLSHFYNMGDVAPKIAPLNTHNACYVPRETHITGNIDIHEMGFTDEKELWLVNTRMSCLCTVSPEHSIVPRWHPPFISAYDLTDRCHLNGLAMRDGQPSYVSALGTTDTAAGWRKDKAHGGMLMDIRDNRMISSGLSMPHSPRWYQDKLWVLESGAGSLATVDEETGKLTTIVELPGFTRGIGFIGRYAIIGLSQVRETAVFAGLPLTERCQDRQCGVYIVDIIEKKVVAFVVFSGEVQEIFSIQIIPASFPTIMEMDNPLLATTYSIPHEALQAFSKPDPLQIALEQANILYSRRQFDEAIIEYKALLDKSPENAIAHYNLGLSYLDSKQWQKAIETFKSLLSKDKRHADAHVSLGKAWMGLREWKKAIACFDDAISTDLQFAVAHYQRALALLHQGKYKEGWQAMEWRWEIVGNPPLNCPQLRWNGKDDISDKTLLIHIEDNLAASLLSIRFIPLVAQHCKRLVILCPDDMRLLFKSMQDIDEVYLELPNSVNDFDVFLPIVSIPVALNLTQDSIMSPLPSLSISNEVDVPQLDSDNKLKVGIEWKQGQQENSLETAEELKSLLPLLKNNEANFYSFQTETNQAEKSLLEQYKIKSFDEELISFAHAGALIQQMDLMITVDSNVAQISTLLGKQTWVVLDNNSSWIWQDNSETCEWYPSARLFRYAQESVTDKTVTNMRHALTLFEKDSR